MVVVDALVLDRADLSRQFKNTPVSEIKTAMFEVDQKIVEMTSVILFNNERQTIILKNRFGKVGEVGE